MNDQLFKGLVLMGLVINAAFLGLLGYEMFNQVGRQSTEIIIEN